MAQRSGFRFSGAQEGTDTLGGASAVSSAGSPTATSGGSPQRRSARSRTSVSTTSVPTIAGVAPPGVHPDELGTIQERDKNRALLKDLYDKFQTKERQWEDFAQETKNNLQGIVQNHQVSISRMEQATEGHIKDLVRHHEQTFAQMEQATTRKINSLQSQNEELTRQGRLLGEQNAQLKQELRKENEINKEQWKKLTKDSAAPVEAMLHFERKSNKLEGDIRDLRTKLQQKGLFQPTITVINAPPEEIARRPPVGTIELGEDVFTARLLLRLGFMKGRHDQLAAADSDDGKSMGSSRSLLVVSDSDEEHLEYNIDADENVAGIVVPDLKRGSIGHMKVVVGWLTICVFTAAIQLLSLAVMLINGISSGGCFVHVEGSVDWWLLHLSKGAAMLVAATLMGKQLMEIVNYIMVAELMLKRRSVEVIFTAVMRVTITFTIIGANIAVFRGLTNPADVWMNMTAFAFIASIAGDMLDVSRRGVFGHDIQKITTDMSFQLCFMELYPVWFHHVRVLALLLCGVAVGVFTFVTFFMPDPMCDVGAN